MTHRSAFRLGRYLLPGCALGLLALQAAAQAPVRQWDKTLGSTQIDDNARVLQTTDGGYLLAGSSYGGADGDKSQASRGSADYWLVKLDALGNKVWDRTYGGPGQETLSAVQQTTDGGYILAGSSGGGLGADKTESGTTAFEPWVIKLDANGNKQWDHAYALNLISYGGEIRQTSDGGYILAGSYSLFPGGRMVYSRVLKLDAQGRQQWEKRLIGDTNNSVTSIKSLQQTADGGYILGGSSNSGASADKSHNGWGDYDCWIVKLGATGTKQWDRTYGGSGADALTRKC
jgi:hypothetical protein